MGQDEHQPLNAETDDWVFSSGISLGALLKSEREKRGLSLAQISQQTRLRPHILEAIEEEDWDRLPTATLVKGFIRSYARALELEEDRLIDLYNEDAEANRFPEKFVLPSIQRRSRKPFVIISLAVLLLAVLTGFYAWTIISTHREASTNPIEIQEPLKKEQPIVPDEPRKPKKDPLDEKIDEKNAPSEVETESATELTADVPGVIPVIQESPEITTPAPSETPETVVNAPKVENAPILEVVETTKLLLKGHVKERTWVRITIDGLQSKEYVLGPSDKPEWEAKKGFELLIGNAGGIDLEFNGKRMENLGKQGQVVRIKLPKDEERSTPTE